MRSTTRAYALDNPPTERARLRADLGGLLARERLAAGLTQPELAELAGLSVDGLRHIETGRRRPSERTTRQLAVALRPAGTDVDVAALDLRLRAAAGPSLRTWNRTRPLRAKRVRAYAEAERRLAEMGEPTRAQRVAAGRLRAAELPPWTPPQRSRP